MFFPGLVPGPGGGAQVPGRALDRFLMLTHEQNSTANVLRYASARDSVSSMRNPGSGKASCFDPVTHRPRLMAAQCPTCIFRPGNPMNLRPGRLRQMVSDALREGCQGVICHDTLSYGPHPDFGGALCRGFYDTVGYRNNFVRVMERLGGFTEVGLPGGQEV